jgi:hypothetical protein
MRPLWFDFPGAPSDKESFMWGDSVLVVPKVTSPPVDQFGETADRDLYDEQEVRRKIYPIDVFLPTQDYQGRNVSWYDSLTGQVEMMGG